MGEAFQYPGGVVAVHAQEVTPGDIQLIGIAVLFGHLLRLLLYLLAGIVDQSGLDFAGQYFKIVAAVTGEDG